MHKGSTRPLLATVRKKRVVTGQSFASLHYGKVLQRDCQKIDRYHAK